MGLEQTQNATQAELFPAKILTASVKVLVIKLLMEILMGGGPL